MNDPTLGAVDAEADALVTKLAREALEVMDAIVIIGARVDETGGVLIYCESQGKDQGAMQTLPAIQQHLIRVAMMLRAHATGDAPLPSDPPAAS